MSEKSSTASVDEVAAKETNTVTATETTTAVAVEQLIYVGPNIASERLNKFAVFRGGLPTHADAVFAACPVVKKLFVPVEKLTETLEKISQTGSAFHTWNSQVAAYLSAKGAK